MLACCIQTLLCIDVACCYRCHPWHWLYCTEGTKCVVQKRMNQSRCHLEADSTEEPCIGEIGGTLEGVQVPVPYAREAHSVVALATGWDRAQLIPHSRGIRLHYGVDNIQGAGELARWVPHPCLSARCWTLPVCCHRQQDQLQQPSSKHCGHTDRGVRF